MVDAIFEHPRLVAVYDALDSDRTDLDAYVGIVNELGARRVLDVGCGTGVFALLLADQGLEVTVWAGVSSYPAHALETPEILARAEAALTMAMEWSQSRIEVAVPE